MNTHLPLPKPTRWIDTEVAGALFAAGPSFVASVAGIIVGAIKGQQAAVVATVATLVAALVGLAVALRRSRTRDRREADRKSPADLEGCLYMLHAAILGAKGLAYEETNIRKLRLTIHRVVEDMEASQMAYKVIQLVSYVGDESVRNGKDRQMPGRCGIVGRAITSLKPQGLIREGSFDDYVRVMCDEYGMLVDEARALSDDRFAFVAIPLLKNRRAIGVVYLDSTDPAFFSDRPGRSEVSAKMIAMISTACGGLAPYTSLRYPE